MGSNAGGLKIGGVEMLSTLRPENAEALHVAVRDLAASCTAMFPVGGGTAIDCGLPPARPGIAIDLTGLDRVIDYPADDMTITVEAGMRIAELDRVLAEHGQMLPLDASLPGQATIGGVLATRWHGPRRYGYGAVRDYVLGIEVVEASGRAVRAGGRVVKNVAGYDLMKLHVGAWGTLGIVRQATFRLRPIAEARAAVACGLRPNQVEPALERLNRSQSRPTAVEVVGPSMRRELFDETASAGDEVCLLVLFEECREAVDWQVDVVRHELGEIGAAAGNAITGDAYDRMLETIRDWPEVSPGSALIHASMRPSDVPAFCRASSALLPNSPWLCHAGNGFAMIRVDDSDKSQVESAMASLRGELEDGATVWAPRCGPLPMPADLCWPAQEAGLWMQRIKDALDPRGLINPGRYPFTAN